MESNENLPEQAADKITQKARELLIGNEDHGTRVPGSPGVENPPVEEPTDPAGPAAPPPDQEAPAPVSPTGAPAGERAQRGAFLTTAQGARLRDSDHSLTAGKRGPVLLQDHHLREKVTHFDHERIPERVVHARGAAAHGVFVANGAAENICAAAFLKAEVETPTFTRFSTVVGSRGSMDTARDTRGFATKFYTTEGIYDLVGNNIPVFFIQDGIKFPDVIHAVKPHPDREIPQAQSAHDSFWDFVSLHTEAQHHTIWNMADRGIPRSYRMMEGFGVHTFRLTNAEGETTLAKFHWKPHQGVHSLTWEEAQIAGGTDPDYHRRDLADAIEAGATPKWDLGVQVFPDTEDETFEGIDLLDPTKLVPEELAPVQVIGTLTLTGNPTNYFAETEQVAFHPGHLAPGIDVTNDPLLQGRLFSYIDTQITRLGGPNFAQLPINRPQADVNDMLRDGMHQSAVHSGVAPYRPNSLDGGCPFQAGAGDRPFIDVPTVVPEGRKVREHPASFADHFSQARLFYRSLSQIERDHTSAAYTFELSRCYEQNIRIRQLQCLANIDADLCATVADGLGLPAPEPTVAPGETTASPALSQIGGPTPVSGRQVGVIVDDESDADQVRNLIYELGNHQVIPLIVAPHGGTIGELTVQRTYAAAASIEFDGLLLTSSASPAPDAVTATDAKAGTLGPGNLDPRVGKLLGEAWRHAKPIGAVGQGIATAEGALPLPSPGVSTGSESDVVTRFLDDLAQHRIWERFPVSTSA